MSLKIQLCHQSYRDLKRKWLSSVACGAAIELDYNAKHLISLVVVSQGGQVSGAPFNLQGATERVHTGMGSNMQT